MPQKFVVNNCAACEPVNRLLHHLLLNGFIITEQQLRDYHFGELYFKVTGVKEFPAGTDAPGFTLTGSVYTCQCHWSRIEIEAAPPTD